MLMGHKMLILDFLSQRRHLVSLKSNSGDERRQMFRRSSDVSLGDDELSSHPARELHTNTVSSASSGSSQCDDAFHSNSVVRRSSSNMAPSSDTLHGVRAPRTSEGLQPAGLVSLELLNQPH